MIVLSFFSYMIVMKKSKKKGSGEIVWMFSCSISIECDMLFVCWSNQRTRYYMVIYILITKVQDYPS